MKIYFYVAITIFIIIYFVIPFSLVLLIKQKQILTFCFLMYTVILICFIMFFIILKITVKMPYIYVSLDINLKYLGKTIIYNFSKISLYDPFVNLLLLFPLGGTLLILEGYDILFFPHCFVYGICFGTFFEVIQLIFPINRVVQVVDIMFNGLSVVVGGIIFYIILKSIGMLDKLKKTS